MIKGWNGIIQIFDWKDYNLNPNISVITLIVIDA